MRGAFKTGESALGGRPLKGLGGYEMKTLFMAATALCLVATPAFAQTGNGGPSGPHYNLNLVGTNQKDNMPDNLDSGHTIFVKILGRTDILLCNSDQVGGDCEGVGFKVLDKNGTDGEAAFALPNPDPENDGVTTYSVFARALGKPGGSADMTTCAYDDGVEVCSVSHVDLDRIKGRSSFTNVSRQLLYIYADLDGDGTTERYPLFDEDLEDYFWKYENDGLRLAQLRFYPCWTNVETNTTSCY